MNNKERCNFIHNVLSQQYEEVHCLAGKEENGATIIIRRNNRIPIRADYSQKQLEKLVSTLTTNTNV